MISTSLLTKMSEYLSKAITLDEFENWFVQSLPIVYGSPDDRAIEIADQVELGFAQLNESLISETEFIVMLSEIFQNSSFIQILIHNKSMNICSDPVKYNFAPIDRKEPWVELVS